MYKRKSVTIDELPNSITSDIKYLRKVIFLLNSLTMMHNYSYDEVAMKFTDPKGNTETIIVYMLSTTSLIEARKNAIYMEVIEAYDTIVANISKLSADMMMRLNETYKYVLKYANER